MGNSCNTITNIKHEWTLSLHVNDQFVLNCNNSRLMAQGLISNNYLVKEII